MTAVQLMQQRGGWPLNCIALPDGRPFWGGTYFRKTQWKKQEKWKSYNNICERYDYKLKKDCELETF